MKREVKQRKGEGKGDKAISTALSHVGEDTRETVLMMAVVQKSILLFRDE